MKVLEVWHEVLNSQHWPFPVRYLHSSWRQQGKASKLMQYALCAIYISFGETVTKAARTSRTAHAARYAARRSQSHRSLLPFLFISFCFVHSYLARDDQQNRKVISPAGFSTAQNNRPLVTDLQIDPYEHFLIWRCYQHHVSVHQVHYKWSLRKCLAWLFLTHRPHGLLGLLPCLRLGEKQTPKKTMLTAGRKLTTISGHPPTPPLLSPVILTDKSQKQCIWKRLLSGKHKHSLHVH